MKKALSLIEVLVSVVILSVSIATLLKTNEQSFKAVENFNKSSINSFVLEIANLQAIKETSDKSYYASDLVKFDIDDIDRKLKDIKFEIDVEKQGEEKADEESDLPVFVEPIKIDIFSKEFKNNFTILKFSVPEWKSHLL